MTDFISRREADATERARSRDQEILQRGELHDVVLPERPADDKQVANPFAAWTPELENRRTALRGAIDTRTEGEGHEALVQRAHAYLHFLMGTGADADPTS